MNTALQGITLYPINSLAAQWTNEPFDKSVLPAPIVPGVTVEDVRPLFRDDTWLWVERELGKRDLEALKRVKTAIVHRYTVPNININDAEQQSVTLVTNLSACLRLIRPMTQEVLVIRARLLDGDAISNQGFDHPIHLTDIPDVQRAFSLRNRDLLELQTISPRFLYAMAGEYWKFRMPVSLHEMGHFADTYWKNRLFLWTSAIEAIFTSQTTDHEHSGSPLAKARIKWFLGANTKIYAPGDVPSFAPQPQPTISDILDDLYEMRNCLAHGEKVPDKFFPMATTGVVTANSIQTLEEAASFVLRASLLKILRDNLLDNFKGGPESQAYFAANGLINSKLARPTQ